MWAYATGSGVFQRRRTTGRLRRSVRHVVCDRLGGLPAAPNHRPAAAIGAARCMRPARGSSTAGVVATRIDHTRVEPTRVEQPRAGNPRITDPGIITPRIEHPPVPGARVKEPHITGPRCAGPARQSVDRSRRRSSRCWGPSWHALGRPANLSTDPDDAHRAAGARPGMRWAGPPICRVVDVSGCPVPATTNSTQGVTGVLAGSSTYPGARSPRRQIAPRA